MRVRGRRLEMLLEVWCGGVTWWPMVGWKVFGCEAVWRERRALEWLRGKHLIYPSLGSGEMRLTSVGRKVLGV